MSHDSHIPESRETPAEERRAQPDQTPRISDTNTGVGSGAGYLAKASAYVPQSVTGYFGKSTDAPPDTPGSAAAEPDDETSSTTTDLTELSTKAQAGSLAPSRPGSPISTVSADDPTEENHGEDVDAENARPWIEDDYATTTMPPEPKIHLEPRMYPLAVDSATHGGILLCEDTQAQMDIERAGGILSPAHEGTEVLASNDEDDYSSDDGKEDAQGGKVKRLARRVKGGAKVVSGKIRRDPERVEQGKDMMGER
ncbi:hypothetical protein DFH07DRAFT_844906 [Mycena maculata]|uniref:Uncharacterized protein n=1 Tax=Mycena maculata TaxID=230809 RepID=A0AAD7MVR6_9AGAR|nr:hypothetical protein DFH07DRAFT_844906 [Mycena maculata]